jgi:hypothetical protein
LRDFDSAIEQRLIEHLQARTNATLSRGRLEQAAREWSPPPFARPAIVPMAVVKPGSSAGQ